MGIPERIEKLMNEHGISRYKLSKDTGIPYTTLTQILNHRTENPQVKALELIADYFNKPLGYITGREDDNLNPSKVVDIDMTSVEMIKIPIYGEIRAGYNSLAMEDIIGYEIVAKDTVSDGEYFFLIVKGDSMIDEGIAEGMRVLVRKQRTCQHGKIGVVIVNGDEGTLKRVYYDDDNVILQASNKSIPPRVYPLDEVMIQGQVVQVQFDV
ncbi:LexA repressor [compost metagenome]